MGRIYIVGGSRGMAGAAVLAASGAVRAGAGLVRVGIVKSQQKAVVLRAPVEITTDALPEGRDGRLSHRAASAVTEAVKKFSADVVALGPGLGQNPQVKKTVRALVKTLPMTLVLDADGLNSFAGAADLLRKRTGDLIITPHEGELSRLLQRPSVWIHRHREEAARTAAKKFQCVCVLKGAGSLVTNGTVIWKNPTGNPGMASGGMGDVLTGIIAAFCARMPIMQAAAAGVFVHGFAGDLAYLASDVAKFVPNAVAKI